jgi:hypothetical protein
MTGIAAVKNHSQYESDMFCVWVLRANWQSTETGRVCSRNLSREVIFKQGNLGRALRLAESASPGAQIWGKEYIGESTEVFAWSAAKFLIGEQERARCHMLTSAASS